MMEMAVSSKRKSYVLLCVLILLSLLYFLARQIHTEFSQSILIMGSETAIFKLISRPMFPHHIHSMSAVKVLQYYPENNRKVRVRAQVTEPHPYVTGNHTYEHRLLIDHHQYRLQSEQTLMGWVTVNTMWQVKTAKNQTRKEADLDKNPLSYLNETTVLTVPWLLSNYMERYERHAYRDVLMTTKSMVEGTGEGTTWTGHETEEHKTHVQITPL